VNLSLALSATVQAAPVFDNGTVVNGGGLSVLTAPASTFGFGAQAGSNNRVADDFTVPVGTTWNVQSLSLDAYQTGAPFALSGTVPEPSSVALVLAAVAAGAGAARRKG